MDKNTEKEKSGLARLYAYLQKIERKRLKKKLKKLEAEKHTSTCYKDGKPCECSGLCRENC